jgi:phage baseplate assembly protein W
MSGAGEDFGRGIIWPFERDGQGDFRNDSGNDSLRNDIACLLSIRGPIGKTPGELPWDTDMGGSLEAVRHRHMHSQIVEALVYEATAGVLERYESRARITGVTMTENRDPRSSERKVAISYVPTGSAQKREQDSVELPIKE